MEFTTKAHHEVLNLYRGASVAEGDDCRARGIVRTAPMSFPGLHAERPPIIHTLATSLPRLSNPYTRGEIFLPADASPDMVAYLSAQQAIRHVNQSSADSPFVSFTGKSAVAREFATMYGSRPQGVLIATQVTLRAAIEWSVEGGHLATVHLDTFDRVWLSTATFRAIGLEWIPTFERLDSSGNHRVEPAPEGVRRRGFYDDEWLLLRGQIPAADLTLTDA